MPPVGFELTISAGERPHTYAVDRAATGIGRKYVYKAHIPDYYVQIWIAIHI